MKKSTISRKLCAACFSTLFTAGLSLSSPVWADSLVGVWSFDGSNPLEMTAGNAASGDWANLTDGTIFGSDVAFVENPITGSTVAKFNGSGGIYLGSMPLVTASGLDFSLAGYVQNSKLSNYVIWGNRYPDVNGGYNFFKLTSYKLEYVVGGSSKTIENPMAVDSDWRHVAITHEGDVLKYYVNGSLIGSTTITTDMRAAVKFSLGGDANNKTEYWTGQIDSFAAYASALTQEDVILQARARLSGMTAYWNASDYADGANWVDRINGRVADFTPSDLASGTDKKFEFNRVLNASESAWYDDAAKTTHVYDTSGAWNSTAVTVPTTAWVNSGSLTYAAPTAPTGLYVGGGTASASVTATLQQLTQINLIEVLRKGSLVSTATTGLDFNKTLYVDGGSVDFTASTFNLTNGARVVVASDSSFKTDYMRVGQGDGSAQLIQLGGTVTTGNLHIGDNGNEANGIYAISGGSLQSAQISVGQYMGRGALNVSGGTVFASEIRVANASKATGEMNVSGGKVIVQNSLLLANSADNQGATLNTTGGDLIVRKQIQVGVNATATATLSGGAVVAREGTMVGANAGGVGTLNLSGAVFATPFMNVGVNGKGYVAQTAGAASIGTLQLGTNRVDGQSVAYALSGGTLSAQNIIGADAFAFTGGTLAANRIDASLNQTGGTLEIQKYADGLNWKRYDYVTTNMNNEIWSNLDSLEPVAEGIGLIGNSAAVPSATNYMVVYDGYIYIPEDGVYTFYVNSDDHTRTFIDGASIGDSAWVNNLTYNALTAELTQGLHKIDLQMRQGSGGQTHNIEIQYPDGERHDINSLGILFSEDNTDFARMVIDGDYSLSKDSVINIDVNTETGEADLLIVNGDMTADGVLNLIFHGDAVHQPAIQLLDIDGLADLNFSQINLVNSPYADGYWDLSGLMGNGNGFIVSTVPEPSAWLILLVGACGLAARRPRGAKNVKA